MGRRPAGRADPAQGRGRGDRGQPGRPTSASRSARSASSSDPLGEAGLVAHRDERQGPGRPRRWYCLTPAAETLFPKRYGQLTNQLLGFIEDSDPDLVASAFQRRAEQRRDRAAARLAGRDFEDRVRELTRILDEDGYLADCEQAGDGTWLVTERNCAILDVARHHREACSSELAFLRAVLPGRHRGAGRPRARRGPSVRLSDHPATGHHGHTASRAFAPAGPAQRRSPVAARPPR